MIIVQRDLKLLLSLEIMKVFSFSSSFVRTDHWNVKALVSKEVYWINSAPTSHCTQKKQEQEDMLLSFSSDRCYSLEIRRTYCFQESEADWIVCLSGIATGSRS